MTNVPFLPNMTPWVLPAEPFNQMIAAYGQRFTWLKGHDCPCVYGNQTVPGSPDPGCTQCLGKGVYWDPPVGPFNAMMTFMHMSPSPDEPGLHVDENVGPLNRAEPSLTIPYTVDTSGRVWREASVYDAWVQVDAVDRFSTSLQLGRVTAVPYNQGLSIAVTGAVTTYDQSTRALVNVTGYAVSGTTVLLPSQYPINTSYVVEFYANPVYVAFRKAGGLPHVRPFDQIKLPRRFMVQSLDLWSRGNNQSPFPT